MRSLSRRRLATHPFTAPAARVKEYDAAFFAVILAHLKVSPFSPPTFDYLLLVWPCSIVQKEAAAAAQTGQQQRTGWIAYFASQIARRPIDKDQIGVPQLRNRLRSYHIHVSEPNWCGRKGAEMIVAQSASP